MTGAQFLEDDEVSDDEDVVIMDVDMEVNSTEIKRALESEKNPNGSAVLDKLDTGVDIQATAMFTGGSNDENDGISEWIENYRTQPFQLVSLFPPLTWFPSYVRYHIGKPTDKDISDMGALPYSVKADVIAGITVGCMLVPQCLAYALLAGLPAVAGLWAAFAPLLVYSLLGTIRQVQVGPSALMSLLTGQALDAISSGLTAQQRCELAALISFSVGIISLILGVLRFGFVVDFMSHSVMSSFCTAAGITIATSQLKNLFGLELKKRYKHWYETAYHIAKGLSHPDIPASVMGITLLLMLLFFKYWKSAGSESARSKHLFWRWFPKNGKTKIFKTMKMIADLSAILCVVVGCVWGHIYRQYGIEVPVVGNVDDGNLKFVLPFASGMDFDKNPIIVSAIVMSIVGFLETMAVGGKFASQARYNYDPNQELLALGLSNVAGSFMGAYPTTGSFSRTAVNAMLGATSQVSQMFSCLIVLASVYILLPVIAKLPMASLAPIIIQGAIGVINIKDYRVAWTVSPGEFIVMISTLVVSLWFTVKEGLAVGFALSMLKTMKDLGNPNLAVCGRVTGSSFHDIRNFPKAELLPNIVVVRMDARLTFANARKMKEFCLNAVKVREEVGDRIDYLIIDFKAINKVDLTGCEMLEIFADGLKKKSQKLVLANVKGAVAKYLQKAGVPQHIQHCGGHICIDMDQAVSIVQGGDDSEAWAGVQDLVQRVQSNKKLIRSASGNISTWGI